MSDPFHCAFCGASEPDMSGTWSNGRITICHECIGRMMSVLCYANRDWFEEQVTKARNYRPDSN
jgi:hypothetical protein